MRNVFRSVFQQAIWSSWDVNEQLKYHLQALYGQVRLEASMLTVGVDTAAAVMNLHMQLEQGYNYVSEESKLGQQCCLTVLCSFKISILNLATLALTRTSMACQDNTAVPRSVYL